LTLLKRDYTENRRIVYALEDDSGIARTFVSSNA